MTLDCETVLDYWDLQMENPEGIAFNYLHDPPLLYITTDPSNPSGPPYVGVLYVFVKPAIGTGLLNYDPKNPPFYPTIQCDGCADIDNLVEQIQNEYFGKVNHEETMISIQLVIICSIIFCPFILVVVGISIYTVRSYDPARYRKEKINTQDTELLPKEETPKNDYFEAFLI